MDKVVDKISDVIYTNTYARRVTKHHAYDYEDAIATGDSLKKTELANVDHTFNMYIEKVLTKVHQTSQMFVIVNMSLPDYPIVYASNEFIDFWEYERHEVFQADGRLNFMAGERTSKRMPQEMKHSMDTAIENTLDHRLYTKKDVLVHTTIGLLKLDRTQDRDTFVVITFDPFRKRGDVPSAEQETKLNEIELGQKSLVAPMLKIKDEILEYEGAEKRTFSWRLLEDSFLRKAWDWIALIFTVWATISVPFEAAFEGGFLTIPELDVVTDAVFIIDLALNFRTTYVNADGLVIGDTKKMAKHYFRGWFIIDACSSIPWQCIQYLLGTANSSTLDSVLRILKLIRVLRICKVAKKLDGYTRNGPLSLALLMTLFVMVGHWEACIWFWMGRHSYAKDAGGLITGTAENMRNGTGWITQYFTENKYNFTGNLTGEAAKDYHPELYASSLYFIMTILCTVGFGNIAPYDEVEMLYCILIMLLGAFMYALIFGSATNIIMRMGSQQSRFLNQLTDIENFLAVNKFPLDLRNRIEDFFYYHWYNSKGIEHSKMMTLWPKTLKEDTSLYLHRVLFGEWPVFNEANTGCRRALSSLVQRVGFGPGDCIVHKDDCVKSIYFVVRGHLKIIRDGDVLGILTKGDTFGQKFWPTRTAGKSDTDVEAMTYSEIEVLDHKDLKDIFVKFPDYWDLWENKLEITYELCQEDKIFNALPRDLGAYVANERTPATSGGADAE